MSDGHDLYGSDRYVRLHPNLHNEDAEWKASIISPFVVEFLSHTDAEVVQLLDVGGGSGEILRLVAGVISDHHKRPEKHAVDLSPKMIERQQETNPDLKSTRIEDVRDLSFEDKEMDLALAVDVVEHVMEPERALSELARISQFAILKVPLENNIYNRLLNLMSRGRLRDGLERRFGHVNWFTRKSLDRLVEAHMGRILSSAYSNVFGYYKDSGQAATWPSRRRFENDVGYIAGRVSPAVAARLMTDFRLLLVECK